MPLDRQEEIKVNGERCLMNIGGIQVFPVGFYFYCKLNSANESEGKNPKKSLNVTLLRASSCFIDLLKPRIMGRNFSHVLACRKCLFKIFFASFIFAWFWVASNSELPRVSKTISAAFGGLEGLAKFCSKTKALIDQFTADTLHCLQ